MSYQRGDTRTVMQSFAAANSSTKEDLVAVVASLGVKASEETWVTDLATTRRNFASKFLGVAEQTKPANGSAHGNAGANASKVRVSTGGVHTYACKTGTYAIGTLVGPAKQTGNALENQIVDIVTTEDQAIGRVVGREGVDPTLVEVEIISRVAADALQSATMAKTNFTGLKLLGADGRNGAGAVTLTGAVVGERLIAVVGQVKANTGAHSFLFPTQFESVITVADQIQQSGTDLSANTYLFFLAPALT